jgi:hypothetical protein
MHPEKEIIMFLEFPFWHSCITQVAMLEGKHFGVCFA